MVDEGVREGGEKMGRKKKEWKVTEGKERDEKMDGRGEKGKGYA